MLKGAFARKNIALFGLIFLIGACASGNKFQFKRSGQFAFAGIKRLVVAPVTGIKQRHELEKKLIAEIEKTGFYVILRDDDVRHIMMKHNLTYDDIAAADSSRLSEIGAWLQADGILFSELKTLWDHKKWKN